MEPLAPAVASEWLNVQPKERVLMKTSISHAGEVLLGVVAALGLAA